ncbi:hypothetical protein [Cellulomonas sp. URHE0023]|uniref:hypothetical protein n=1 Tax=Cellulomonas sp. URHE0023 TaxID=1380354 RepID=UPI000485CD2F|nr:hypothetical protein [Cellulomonas sp. URHE0023]
MSTENNAPADETQTQPMDAVDETETQRMDALDETQDPSTDTVGITATQPIDPVDETETSSMATVDVAETQTLDPVDETEAIAVVEDEPTADDEPTFDHDPRPTAEHQADPLGGFAAVPAEPYPPAASTQSYAGQSYGEQPSAAPTATVVVEPQVVEPGIVTEPGPRRLRVGTVVWGLILATCGLGVIAWASGARIDFQLALIILLAVAGTALLVGSIVSGARHARR